MKKVLQYLLVAVFMVIIMVTSSACKEKLPENPIDTGSSTLSATEPENTLVIDVMEAPYFAKGDGVTSDRAVVQQAINDAAEQGGGTVVLTEGHSFLMGNLYLRSNVTLHLAKGAKILQNPDRKDYVYPLDYPLVPSIDDGEGTHKRGDPWVPATGNNVYDKFPLSESPWCHAWTWNFPFIYSGAGNENVRLTSDGDGTISIVEHKSCNESVHMTVVFFTDTKGSVLSDIIIDGYSGYCLGLMQCENFLINNVTIKGYTCGCGDGLHVWGSKNGRVTGCEFYTSDDSFNLGTTYGDLRGYRYYDGNDSRPCENIVIDHNICVSLGTSKGFGAFYWGEHAPDLEKIQYSNIYIHDNDFSSLGFWPNHGNGDKFRDPYNFYDVGRILRTFKIKKNVEVTDNGKIII